MSLVLKTIVILSLIVLIGTATAIRQEAKQFRPVLDGELLVLEDEEAFHQLITMTEPDFRHSLSIPFKELYSLLNREADPLCS